MTNKKKKSQTIAQQSHVSSYISCNIYTYIYM